ncbi:MAG: hypothetical protein HKP58_04935 [Desulfatitalea sp.]|nr:hypothetical protein [Desulfatitalea sp.]NNJ99738.1 hypothetical protein [Desulfatitalea sp.]
MYIQSYQIHNVLNVYRKQLSQDSTNRIQRPKTPQVHGDKVALSRSDQRQSLIDKVSAEIVDHMAHLDPQKGFEKILAQRKTKVPNVRNNGASHWDVEFTYSAIDENNRKTSNSLPVQRLNAVPGEPVATTHKPVE